MLPIKFSSARESELNNREKTAERRKTFERSLPSFEEIFSLDNLYKSAMRCRKGVQWKPEVQRYHADIAFRLCNLSNRLKRGSYKTQGFKEFDIYERGKPRHIKAPTYEDRIVQRCLCDNYLVPLLSRYIIYDNSATIKDRGTEYAIKRLRAHMEKFYRRNKNKGYILVFDFKDYFNSINHDILIKKLNGMIKDERTKKLTRMFIKDFGEKGLGLGSQVSQICAVTFPDEIDHMFKDIYKEKYYARYMDDGYAIVQTLDRALFLKKILKEACAELDLKINDKKIKIIPLTHQFTFLKHRFRYGENGGVVVRCVPKTFQKMRKRINAFRKGKIAEEELMESYRSWRGSVRKYKNYKTIKNIDNQIKEARRKARGQRDCKSD